MRWVRLLGVVVILTLLVSHVVYADDYIEVTDYYKDIGIVQCPKYLNIRRQPDITSDVVGIIKSGGACSVVQKGEDWCLIRSGEISGYIMTAYLLVGEEAESVAKETANKRIVFTDSGLIYAEPSIDSAVWEKPVNGSVYLVNDDLGDWIRVDMAGAEGYVSSTSSIVKFYGLDTATKTYTLTNVSKTRTALVKYAMRFLGNNYIWGGDNPNTGADCSGFVRYVYKDICPDVWLPRVSYEQCYCGESISSLSMRPGDLLFYAYADGRVHHVAMYIGNGMIIHAASKRQGIILSAWNYQIPKYIRNMLND